jgi:hypothetical protein
MSSSIAIMQPYFLPYLGYWQLMSATDKFILFDDVNYIKKGWINRNRILVNNEPHFITVPLEKASQNTSICDLSICESQYWRQKTLQKIEFSYKKAAFISDIQPLIYNIIMYPSNNLSDFLSHSILNIQEYLGLKTEVIKSSRVYNNSHLVGKYRILDICKKENAELYINASGGRDLYSADEFRTNGIHLKFIDSNLPNYWQFSREFVSGLSILDVLMFNSKETVKEFLNRYQLSEF